jgi:hypothetical protein
VDLRYFGELHLEEIADAVSLSVPAHKQDLAVRDERLCRALAGS